MNSYSKVHVRVPLVPYGYTFMLFCGQFTSNKCDDNFPLQGATQFVTLSIAIGQHADLAETHSPHAELCELVCAYSSIRAYLYTLLFCAC